MSSSSSLDGTVAADFPVLEAFKLEAFSNLRQAKDRFDSVLAHDKDPTTRRILRQITALFAGLFECVLESVADLLALELEGGSPLFFMVFHTPVDEAIRVSATETLVSLTNLQAFTFWRIDPVLANCGGCRCSLIFGSRHFWGSRFLLPTPLLGLPEVLDRDGLAAVKHILCPGGGSTSGGVGLTSPVRSTAVLLLQSRTELETSCARHREKLARRDAELVLLRARHPQPVGGPGSLVTTVATQEPASAGMRRGPGRPLATQLPPSNPIPASSARVDPHAPQ